jgi:GR25 family glycosyltransferase involved in LPS biosynthesis
MPLPNPSRMPFVLFHAGLTGLAVRMQQAFVRLSSKPQRLAALGYFQNGAALRAMRWKGEQDYPVIVMNRLRDNDRLQRFRSSCERWGISFERVEGIDLKAASGLLTEYADRIADLCYNQHQFVRGIYGCFLAHREAWLRFRDSAREWALICEDDALFLGPIPRQIADYEIPPGTDIVFANLRMATGLLIERATITNRPPVGFEFISTAEALASTLGFNPHLVAPGGDGYFLSRSGVLKILKIFDETRMAFDVDWFLLFQSLDETALAHFLSIDQTGRFDGHQPHPIRLNSLVMLPCLVDQAQGESKVKRMQFCSREEMLGKGT